jgi:hypothetical protein
MNRKIKPSSDYIWFQMSEFDNDVYVHLTWENDKYVRYFCDDKLPSPLVKREEINSPRCIASLSQIMQSTFFDFMMYSA